ncbi:MAG: AmmeMemoRadiSam system radical SAM enzyme [Acidobacteria bacterium]|jgi:pyruvate formate lyase activating enzyme|nr:AmmeMemoRadiSam system radical SAM enzyme [Acidobacteriota bacterium]
MPATATPLSRLLARHTREGELVETLENQRVRCVACGHRCRIPPGHEGICRVRFNEGGVLRVPYGYVSGLQLDPIEKKPFFHALPGATALSFGMLGCDFHCAYCQNWISSQAVRDPGAGTSVREITPEEIARLGRERGARIVTSTYNEPLITSEWAVAVFRQARQEGLLCSYVSNGNGTEEVLDYLQPWVSLYKVDLKGFRDRPYRDLGGTLDRVLWTIQALHERGFWVEVVTLVVPGHNDSDEELTDIARFLVSVSRDIPWHVTAFHPDYRMDDRNRTSARTLLRAAEIGAREGLHFVYAGNLPGALQGLENTYCPSCRALLVERTGFRVLQNRVEATGHCPDCRHLVPGVWS